LDNDAKITYVNDNVLNFEQKTVEEIIGKDAESVSLAFFSTPDIHKLITEGITGKEIIREFEVVKDDQHFLFRRNSFRVLLRTGKKDSSCSLRISLRSKNTRNNWKKQSPIRTKS
jgi:hypothetical protein